MRRWQVYRSALFITVLAASGCSGSGGTSSAFPAVRALHESLRGSTHGAIVEYTIPHPSKDVPKTFPVGITTGPDGALWFAERGAGKAGRITTSGDITQYRISGRARYPFNVATGPDGNLWLTGGSLRTYRQESHGAPDPYGAIIRMTPAGVVTGTFDLPTMYSDARQITAGPDGNLWFTEKRGVIGKMTTAGELLNEFPIPHDYAAFAITVGSDGALWFGETFHHKLGRITMAGDVTTCFVPSPAGLVTGPDGNLWVSAFRGAKITRVTTSCAITGEFKLSAGATPKNDALGSDGNIYVAEFDAGKIGEIDPSNGQVTEYAIPTPKSGPWGITSGPDGNIWFTESATGKIGMMSI